MRSLVAGAMFVIAAGQMSFGSGPDAVPALTVLLQFQGETSTRSVEALRIEVTKLLKPAGLELDYRLGSELDAGDTPTDVIVVKFKGVCRHTPLAPALDERGPFAFTYVSNGEIIPFAEVACDRVRTSLGYFNGAIVSDRGDWLLGRALGRVVAHEIYHILTKATHHAKSGVARKSMSSNDLSTETLTFEQDEIRKLHEWTVARR